MTQILNVPMPADEAIKIIRSMFDSNKMIEVVITSGPRMIRLESVEDMRDEKGDRIISNEVTINSITPFIPKYEIGNEVMILATGEISDVMAVVEDDNGKGRAKYGVYVRKDLKYCHWSEICKIA